MFAIIGSWPVDASLEPEQLSHIASNVRHERGFVRGYWGQAPGDDSLAHAVVVLAEEEDARRVAAGVTAAIPSALAGSAHRKIPT